MAQSALARPWLELQADLGRSPNTIAAYGRGAEDYLRFCTARAVDWPTATREHIGHYVQDLNNRVNERPTRAHRTSDGIVPGLSNATIQQRLTAVRLLYDGYCTYGFFDQCAHRMACAKCSFYRPKATSADQLVEGKQHLQRLLQEIPLLDDERAAVEDGLDAMESLLQRLAAVPAPDGTVPNQSSPFRRGCSLPDEFVPLPVVQS